MADALFLTPGAISQLFELDYCSSDVLKQFQVDFNLLVSHWCHYDAFNETFFSLCDFTHNFPNFIFTGTAWKKNKEKLKVGDIVKVTAVSSYHDNQHNSRVFIIESFKLCGQSPFSVLSFTQTYDPLEGVKDKVYLRNEPLAMQCNLINHLSSLPTNVTLFVKVLTKTPLIPYKSNHGIFFFFDSVDQEKARLRVVAFNSNAQFFYSMIKVNCFYQIKGRFAKQKGSFRSEEQLDEIYLSNDSEVIEITSCNREQANETNEFHSIQYILSASPFLLVNVIGKVLNVHRVIMSKANGMANGVRKITITDAYGSKVDVCLWNHYTLYLIRVNDVVAFYDIQIKQYEQSKVLTVVPETKVVVNPRNRQAFALKKKLDKSQVIQTDTLYSAKDYYMNVKVIELGLNQLPSNERVRIKAVFTSISHNSTNYYEGCVDLSCKGRACSLDKKKWTCNKCKRASQSFNYYYSLRAIITDCSGSLEVVLINLSAVDLLGLNASQYEELLASEYSHVLALLSDRIMYQAYYLYCTSPSSTPIEITHLEEINQQKESRALVNRLRSRLFDNDLCFNLAQYA